MGSLTPLALLLNFLVHIKHFTLAVELPFVVKFMSTVTWQENDGKKGSAGLDCIFPNTDISGCMEHESSLSAGNFYDLYGVGQILPAVLLHTPVHDSKGQT